MKAITLDRYGPFNAVLKVAEIEKPTPTGRQVLIKVSAAAVNQADYQLAHGEVRLFTGFFRPKIKSLGYDLAGHVEAVGQDVTRFKPGDKVFGVSSRDPIVDSQSRWMYDYGS